MTGNVHVTSHWGAFTKPLLCWKSNKHYTFLCVCVGACACVHTRVGAGAQAWVSVRLCSLPTPTCHVPPYCHLWSVWLHHIFRHYPIKDTIFGKLVNTKCVFWFSVHFLFETFLILRRIQQGTVIKVKPFSCKLCVIFVGCKWNLNFFFWKKLKYQVSSKSV
jgi:hypothetical protein